MAFSLDLSILSLVPEFKQLQFEDPRIIVNIERRGFLEIDAEDDSYQSLGGGHSMLA